MSTSECVDDCTADHGKKQLQMKALLDGCPGETESQGSAAQCEGCPGQMLCKQLSSSAAHKEEMAALQVRMNAIKHKILVVSGKGGKFVSLI